MRRLLFGTQPRDQQPSKKNVINEWYLLILESSTRNQNEQSVIEALRAFRTLQYKYYIPTSSSPRLTRSREMRIVYLSWRWFIGCELIAYTRMLRNVRVCCNLWLRIGRVCVYDEDIRKRSLCARRTCDFYLIFQPCKLDFLYQLVQYALVAVAGLFSSTTLMSFVTDDLLRSIF